MPDDLLDRVRGVARLLDAVGGRLRPGDRIITGAVVQIPVGSGEAVAAKFDGLGAVGVVVT